MTSPLSKRPCVTCNKGGAIVTCDGCEQWFCGKHFFEHRQKLNSQVDDFSQECDLFQQNLNQDNEKHPLLSRINEWEQQSIKKIKLAAEQVRKDLYQYLDQNMTKLKTPFFQITKELQEGRKDDDYSEIDLNRWIGQLKQLRERLQIQTDVDIIEDDQTKPAIRLIRLEESQTMIQTPTPKEETRVLTRSIAPFVNISVNDRWLQHGVTVAGGYGQGNRSNQLYGPHGLYIDDEKTLYIADYDNHRIVRWKYGEMSAQVIAGINGRGNRTDRLDNPSDIIVDKERDRLIICDRNNRRIIQWSLRNQTSEETIISNVNCQGLTMDDKGFLYVSNSGKHEVRRYAIGETDGTIVAGGHGKGDHLNQLNCPTNIFVDQEHSVFVSDSNNHRVVKWMKGANQGIVVAGGPSKGDKLTQLSNPRGVFVDSSGTIYVVDGWNHRVMRWRNGFTQGDVIVGGNGQGERANQLNYPEGLVFDRCGNLYVADCLNHRIQRFDIQRS